MRYRDPGELLRSPALRASFVYGLGGLGFALGNLLLGRSLPVVEFALFALVLSFVQLGIPIGPIGLNVIIIRHQLDPDPSLLFKVILSSSAVGLVLAVIANAFYRVGPLLGSLLFASILAGAAALLAAAHYQRQHRFGAALRLTQGPNFLVLLAAVIPSAMQLQRAWVPCLIIALIYGAFAAGGWQRLLSGRGEVQTASAPLPWHEGLTIVAGESALIFMIQVERLVIPIILAIEDLATFAVLMAIVGSPFRALQQGIGHTLLPRLRYAGSSRERNRLLFVEAAIATLVMALTCVVVWVVTPLLVDWLLKGRYTLAPALVLAALASGLAKVFAAFGMTVVGAVGSAKDLQIRSALSWMSVAIGLVGAVIGARWGLVGLVYGVGVGWLGQGVACSILAYRGLCRAQIH